MSEIVNGWRLPSAEQMDGILAFLPDWTFQQLYPTREFRDAIEATRGRERASDVVATP